MADVADAQSFRMVGARSALLNGPIAEPIEQQINAIENALVSAPEFAFDLAKTLVESVCKTVLADIGQPADSRWDAPGLLKETINRLALLPRDHPNPTRARESLGKTTRGMIQTLQGLCELRNDYGMASHGRDSYSARLDLRHATLAAQAADTIVSFVYRIHRDSRRQEPGVRVYYEDHADFNDTFDRDNEMILLAGVELLPSQVLFYADQELYKAALNDFISEGGAEDADNEDAVAGEAESEEVA